MNGEPMPKDQSEKPTFLYPKLNCLADELCGFNNWVLWKAVFKNGKWTKVPFNPKNGKPADSTDPATWGGLEAACHKLGAGDYDGIGFVVSEDNEIIGIDLDHCRDPQTGEVEPWAHEIIKSIASYSEISPSGTGVRTFVIANLPPGRRKKGDIELYDSKRFLTVTGHVIMGLSRIRPRQEEVNQLHKEVFGEQKVIEIKQVKESRTSNIDDEKIIEKACAASNGDKFSELYAGKWEQNYKSQSEADQALCNHLAFWCNCDRDQIERIFCTSGLCRDKWENREDYRKSTIDNAIASCADTYKGNQQEQDTTDETTAERVAIQEAEKEAEEFYQQKPESLVFPQEAITGVAGQFARLYGTHLEPPTHFFFMSFLTCLGSALSNRLTLKTEIKPQPRLFTILLGESADDRKSTAIDKTVNFFRQTIEGFSVCFGIGSAEGLQRKLKREPVTLLFLDEFKHFAGKCKIQNSVLLPCVNTFFESNRYESWTAKKEIYIPDGYLSILAASTLQTYENIWDTTFTDIGFNNRLFLVPGSGRREHSLPRMVPDYEVERLKEEVGKVLHHADYHQEIDLTDEAKDLYHQWYLNIPQSVHSRRLDTYALRIMSLMAVNEFKEIIDVDTINKTLAICDWQLEARQLYDPVDADNEYAKMEEKIRRVLGRSPRTDRELKQYCNVRRPGLWIYSAAKSNLEKAGEIGKDKKTKKYFIIRA
jgi:hypothetical protein